MIDHADRSNSISFDADQHQGSITAFIELILFQ